MDEIYNWGYYRSHCGENYEKAEFWEEFFARFARLIVDNLNPRSVLDVGCATGYLVAALRDLGVEAYGMDISQAAISRCREDIRPYLAVHSLLDDDRPVGLPARFDLVTNIEVLEHLYEDETEKALSMLCSFSDHILFSSSPFDITEETHVNVRQPEYWARLFATEGFFHSPSFDASSVAPDAVYFTKRPGLDLPRVVEDYEHQLRLVKSSWRSPEPGFYSALLFGYNNGMDTENPGSHYSPTSQLNWGLPLPAGVTELVFYPAQNRRCIAEGLTLTAAGQRLQLTDVRGEPLGEFAALTEPHEPVFAKFCFPEGVPVHLQLEGRIHILDDPYLVTPLVTLREELEGVRKDANIAREETRKALLALEEQQVADEVVQQREEQWRQKEAYWESRERYIHELTLQRDAYKDMYEATTHSFFWRLTAPFRFLLRGLRGGVRRVARVLPGVRQLYPWLSSVRHMGLHTVRFNQRHFGTLEGPRSRVIPSQSELEAQEAEQFSSPLVFSVVTPLFNTPEPYLRDLIQSLKGQSYPHWELCLADGSDDAHAYVGNLVARYAKKDRRIRYQKLAENQGISGNTNAALAMTTGAYVGLLDHDDILNLTALYEMRKAIEETGADFLYSDELSFRGEDLSDVTVVHHKPDFAPDTLRSINYICHFTVFKKDLLEKAGGGYRSEFDGSQDYDMVLRLTEQADKIVHIPELLYFWRMHQSSVAAGVGAKPYTVQAAQKAISAQLERLNMPGEVEVAPGHESAYHVKYVIQGNPKVSIIIPNKDEAGTLKTCITSVLEKSTWDNYEILVVENGSEEAETLAYYEEIKGHPRIRLLYWEEGFNYSAINNFAAEQAQGDYLLLLNNDTEIITPSWIEEMLMFAQRPDVGAVGAKLYYPDDTLQHGGLVLGVLGVAGHSQLGEPRSALGYMGNLVYARNVGGVTGACMMLRKEVYFAVGGLNEKFSVAFNDVDLCMRLNKEGYFIVFTPFAELYHYESKSRGADTAPECQKRFQSEVHRFKHLWGPELAVGDPYFNKNLRLDTNAICFVRPLIPS